VSVLQPGRNLVLIGMMGSGKSTVGPIIAERLGRPFVDTDELVEAEAGKTVRDIFSDDGERAFRLLEAEVIRRVSTLRGQVVAVGGGAVTDPANVTHLRATGDLMLLHGDPATLADRVAESATAEKAGAEKSDRPLLDGADDIVGRLGEIQAARHQYYASAAAGRIDTTGKSPDELADQVLDWARTRPGLLARDERTLG
jgi:shikimate kinase